MAKPNQAKPERRALATLQEALTELEALTPTLSGHAAKRTRVEMDVLIEHARAVMAGYDPIKDPGAVFDPALPQSAGRLVVIALLAQPRVPLGQVGRTYGAGVYAIYYTGNHPAYTGVSDTETPIYVGKADPKFSTAVTAREQGPQLFGRLNEHRKSIRTVENYAIDNNLADPLRVKDFECRKLVCATNAQLVAERQLVKLFSPIWNSEVKICWGISKHGDSAGTRKNRRSPWDVMHPGRQWALDPSLEDQATPDEIKQLIANHVEEMTPYLDREKIIETLIAAFAQDPGLVSAEEAEQDDSLTEDTVLPTESVDFSAESPPG